jgi:hypothetical protein
MQIQSSRLQSVLMPLTGQSSGALPTGYAAETSETRDLVVNAYYVSPRSVGADTMPSLRRLRLVAGPAIGDEEIMQGVEDLQVELGIDESNPRDGTADRWEAPGDLNPAIESVAAVRVWLRVRADNPEVGFVDGKTYQYADQDWTPSGADAGFRRLLVSTTIQLRNTRT